MWWEKTHWHAKTCSCHLFSWFLFIILMLILKGRQVKLYSWYDNWKHVVLQWPWWTVLLRHSDVLFGSVCGLYHLVVKFGITSLVRSQASHQNVLKLFKIGPTLLSKSLKSIFCSYSSYVCALVDIQQNTYICFLFVRRRIPQLPSHVPLRLRHQWVWLQAQSHHRLHRLDVLHGSGQGPQAGVEGDNRRSHPENGRRQLQKWLSHTSFKLW